MANLARGSVTNGFTQAVHTLYAVKCKVYSVQYTVNSLQCTVFNVQCTVYSKVVEEVTSQFPPPAIIQLWLAERNEGNRRTGE